MAKAEVNSKSASDGRTALQLAAKQGQLGGVDMLLKAKADVNANKDEYGGHSAFSSGS